MTAAQRFYETHEDAYDYLVFFNNMNVAASSGAIAYFAPVRNNRTGFGDALIDTGSLYGSPKRLLGVMNMGQLTQYPADPNASVPGRGVTGDTTLTILGHEAGHMFLAYVSVREPEDPEGLPMLGRQLFHRTLGPEVRTSH